MPLRSPKRLLAGLVLLATLPAFSPAAGEPEDELKAAVVLSFLRYSDWPQTLAGNAPLTIGVVGRQSFADTLRSTLEGKPVKEHRIRIVELKSSDSAAACQVVYFATDKAQDVQDVLGAAGLPHVLTIGESKDFLQWGGAVNLLVVDGRMSFEVNLEALDRSGVNISSRLLRFGQIRNLKKGSRS
jgi:YfiR/HmsC-like